MFKRGFYTLTGLSGLYGIYDYNSEKYEISKYL